ncbi:MAG: alpha-E domain-containing protein [Sulfurospirillum sp.]|nr:alpha-E domain-containing protein [Sulfurospirillum sp.]
MQDLLTGNVASCLYWMGRYLERCEASLIEVSRAFDIIIDVNVNEGVILYEKLDEHITYNGASDFLDVAIFGDHGGNLLKVIMAARENAIISRTQLETEAFGSIIKLARFMQDTSKNQTKIDCTFINEALSLTSETWGKLDQRQNRHRADYFIRLGRLVEKVDFKLRLEDDKNFALIVMDEIDTIVQILAPHVTSKDHTNSSKAELIVSINNKIDKIIN